MNVSKRPKSKRLAFDLWLASDSPDGDNLYVSLDEPHAYDVSAGTFWNYIAGISVLRKAALPPGYHGRTIVEWIERFFSYVYVPTGDKRHIRVTLDIDINYPEPDWFDVPEKD